MSASDNTITLGKAETLIEALPYFQRYAGRTFVVKYGGHAMGDPKAAREFADDIVLLKAVGINPVVVHGGGPQIGAMLKKLGVESEFIDGLRVTDKATAEIAEMVLSGAINKELVGWIAKAGGKAIGISGKDGGLVTARKVERTARDPESNIERVIDLGFVGEPSHVDTTIIDTNSLFCWTQISPFPCWRTNQPIAPAATAITSHAGIRRQDRARVFVRLRLRPARPVSNRRGLAMRPCSRLFARLEVQTGGDQHQFLRRPVQFSASPSFTRMPPSDLPPRITTRSLRP